MEDKVFRTLNQHLGKLFAKEISSVTSQHLAPFGTISAEFTIGDTDKTKNMKVIFNNPATILIVGDRKYISKAHNEDFDEEKGLLMCLAKANGISHTNLKSLLKGAQRQVQKK